MTRETVPLSGHRHKCDVEHYDRSNDEEVFPNGWPFGSNKAIVMRPSVGCMMDMDPKKIDNVNRNDVALRLSEMDGGHRGWYGGNYDDMIDRRRGWHDGVTEMMRMIEQIVPDFGYAKRIRPRFGVEGYQVSVDRALTNHDKPWLCRGLRHGPRILGISVEYGQNCGYSAESLFMRGAAAVAAIDTLEEMGYRIELYAVNAISGLYSGAHSGTTIVEVQVKNPGDPVDLDYLAATMCSPLFFRGNCFTFWGAFPWKTTSCLGSAASVPAPFRRTIHVTTLPGNSKEAKDLYEKIVDSAIKSQETLDNVR